MRKKKLSIKEELKLSLLRIKYLEDIIVKQDKNELQDEAARIKGLPVEINGEADIRLITYKNN
jgi:hypothetical protein